MSEWVLDAGRETSVPQLLPLKWTGASRCSSRGNVFARRILGHRTVSRNCCAQGATLRRVPALVVAVAGSATIPSLGQGFPLASALVRRLGYPE
jgi:hypothetical protein